MTDTSEIVRELRTRLIALCNHREHAYKAVMAQGHAVPNYTFKMACIKKIREHVEYFEKASDRANINLVHVLEPEIVAILPTESKNQKTTSYRQKILKMVAWCNDQFNSNQLRLTQN